MSLVNGDLFDSPDPFEEVESGWMDEEGFEERMVMFFAGGWERLEEHLASIENEEDAGAT